MSQHECALRQWLPPKQWHADLTVAGLRPAVTLSHDGASNPSASTAPVLHPLWQHGNQLCLCDSSCKIWPATLGCLLWIIWRLSAQLDQNAFVVKTALRNPKPPREKGRLTTSQNIWVSVVLTRVGSKPCGEMHHDGPRILLSGQDAPPATGNSARLQRNGAESTHIEDLRHSRSAQATNWSCFSETAHCDRTYARCPKGEHQHSHSLPLSCRCQSFDPLDLPGLVPQLCLSVVDPDAHGQQLFLNCGETCRSSFGELTQQKSSRNAINRSDGLSLALWPPVPCCSKENNTGIRAPPCSLPSPCRISWTLLSYLHTSSCKGNQNIDWGAMRHPLGIFSCAPEPCVASFVVHPLFFVFEPHIQKCIFVRRPLLVCDTFRFESPLLPD